MTERSIVEAAERLRRHGEPYLVATVVRVVGAAVRGPGARMILTRFRWVAGTVSGGVLEGDISETGWLRTRDGTPVLMTYDDRSTAPDDDIRSVFGLGCDGSVEVLVERSGGGIDALEVAARCLRTSTRGAIATVFRSSDPAVRVGARLALIAGHEIETGTDTGLGELAIARAITFDLQGAIEVGRTTDRTYDTGHGTVDVLIEAVLPPPRLLLCGVGHDAVPVATLARSVGWDVTVVGTIASELKHSTRERFAASAELLANGPEIARRIAGTDRTVAVVMNHDGDLDREALRMLLGTKVRHIRVLGSASRASRLLGELGLAAGDPRVVATDETGALTPQELALAIIAELQTALARGPAFEIAASHRERPFATAPVLSAG